MMYVRTFLPWIVYGVVPSGSWQWGALAALVVALASIVVQVRAGRGADAVIIEIGSSAFFAVLTIIAFADPDTGLRPYSAALANWTLALIALISLAIHRPFTLGIAKQTTPREFWDLPEFLKINVIITSVWAASFIVAAIVLTFIAHAGPGHTAATVTVQLAGLVVPMVFTNRYVAHVEAKVKALFG